MAKEMTEKIEQELQKILGYEEFEFKVKWFEYEMDACDLWGACTADHDLSIEFIRQFQNKVDWKCIYSTYDLPASAMIEFCEWLSPVHNDCIDCNGPINEAFGEVIEHINLSKYTTEHQIDFGAWPDNGNIGTEGETIVPPKGN
jgi:hypothetical protein